MLFEELKPAMTPGVEAAILKGLTFQQAKRAFEEALVAIAVEKSADCKQAARLLDMSESWLHRIHNGGHAKRTHFNRGGKGGSKPGSTHGGRKPRKPAPTVEVA